MIEESINIIKHGIASLLAVFNTQEVETIVAGLQTNMSEYTIAGSARIINRPYIHPYRQSRTRHCSICGSISHDRRTCQVRIREEERDAEILRQERQEWEEELLRRENNAREQREQRQRQHREYIERVQRENRERSELNRAIGDPARYTQLLLGPERYNQYIQERRLLTPDTLRTPKKRIELVENFEKDTYLEKNENGYTNCNICLEDININSALVFQCGHGCCNKCAKTILRGNGNCHQCREPIRKIRICRLIPLDIFNNLNNYMKI